MFQVKGCESTAHRVTGYLVVLAACLFAVGVVVMGVYGAREFKVRAELASNMRQCATAVNMAHDAHKTIPPFFGPYGGKSNGTFHFHLLPFVERQDLYISGDANGIVIPFLSTEDQTSINNGAGAANLAVNLRLFYTDGGLGELKMGEKPIYLKWGQVTDGTSNTLLFSTKYQQCGANGGSLWLDPLNNARNSPTAATFGASMAIWQAAPTKEACDPSAGTAVSFKSNFIAIVFCDSSVLAFSESNNLNIWQALHTYGCGDIVPEYAAD